MTHEGRLIAGTGVWTGGAFEASRRLSCRRRCRRTTASPLAWARASSHAPAVGYGTHARLRAGVAEARLRAAAPLVSSATLRRNASMRLTTRCGEAKVLLHSGTA